MPKRLPASVVVGVLAAAIVWCVAASTANARPERITMKIATLAPAGTVWMKAMRGVSDYVEKNSGGRVKFNYYAGGVMGDEPDVIRKMKMGVIQGAGITLAGVRLTVPEFQVMELPFLFPNRNYPETDYVYERTFDYFEKAAWERGYKLIAISEAGFAHFWTKGKVQSLTRDFPQQKVWQWEGDPVMLEISKSLGINPVSLPLPETLTALQTGMINAFYGTPLHVQAFQWNKFVDTVYTPSLFYTPAFFIFTRKAWESLPPDIQALVYDENVKKIKEEYLKDIHEADDEALKVLIESGGITAVEIPPQELAIIREKTMKAWETLPGNMFPKEILDEVKRLLEEYRNQ